MFKRKMKNPRFKKAFEKGYKELLLSEETIKAMNKADQRKTYKAKNVDEIFKKLK